MEHNAKVYLAARSKKKADAAIRELKEATGKDAIFLPLDLGNLASVRESAKEFLRYIFHPSFKECRKGLIGSITYSKEDELNVLFNNA